MTAPTATSPIENVLPAVSTRITVGGVAFDALDTQETIAHVIDCAKAGRGGWVITANLDHLKRARVESDYRTMLKQADLVVADGMPLIWASRLQGQPLPERVAGSSVVLPLAEQAAKHNLSVFLLGGNPGVANKAAEVLCKQYPGLKIAGTCCPPFGFERDDGEMERLKESVVSSCADIVYVALGSPKQEYLIRDIRHLLPNAWWLGIGISLSFITGEVQRAPLWMQRVGLEWLHRLIQEPRRLMKRYLVEGLPFAVRLGFGAVGQRFRSKGR